MDSIVILRPVGHYKNLMDDILLQPNKVSRVTISRKDVKKPPEGFRSKHPVKLLSRSSHVEILTDGKGGITVQAERMEKESGGAPGGDSEETLRTLETCASQNEGTYNLTKNGQPIVEREIHLKVGDLFSLLPARHFEFEVISFRDDKGATTGTRGTDTGTGSKEKLYSQACHDDIEVLELPQRKKKRRINEEKLVEDLTCAVCFEVLAYPFAMPCQHNFCYACIRDFSMTSVGVAEQGKLTCPQGCPATVSLKKCVLNRGLDSATCSLYVEGSTSHSNLIRRRNYGADLFKDPIRAKRPTLLQSPERDAPPGHHGSSVPVHVQHQQQQQQHHQHQRAVEAKECRRIRREMKRQRSQRTGDQGPGASGASAPVLLDLT